MIKKFKEKYFGIGDPVMVNNEIYPNLISNYIIKDKKEKILKQNKHFKTANLFIM